MLNWATMKCVCNKTNVININRKLFGSRCEPTRQTYIFELWSVNEQECRTNVTKWKICPQLCAHFYKDVVSCCLVLLLFFEEKNSQLLLIFRSLIFVIIMSCYPFQNFHLKCANFHSFIYFACTLGTKNLATSPFLYNSSLFYNK